MRRLSGIQERTAEGAADSSLRTDTVRGAERAVEEEIIPKVVKQIIYRALKEAEAEVLRMTVKKNFKNSAEENMVLRHKPMRADHDDFLNAVGEAYGGWVNEIHAILDDPQLRRD